MRASPAAAAVGAAGAAAAVGAGAGVSAAAAAAGGASAAGAAAVAALRLREDALREARREEGADEAGEMTARLAISGSADVGGPWATTRPPGSGRREVLRV